MIKLDENLNFEISELEKECNINSNNKIFYNFDKNELIVSKNDIVNIYICHCSNLCSAKEKKIETIKS